MTFNTGNNVPSTDPRDLYDNAENLDKLVNGVDPFYADRKGILRESWAGMENSFTNAQEGRETAFTLSQADKESRFQAFLVSSGYVSKGDYAANVVLEERNEYVAVDAATTGTTAGLYRPGPDATLPLTLNGTWATDSASLVLLGDDVLRQELSSENGSDLVAYRAQAVGAVPRSLSGRLGDFLSIKDFGAVGDGVVDDRAAIQAAFDHAHSMGGGTIYFPPAVAHYAIKSEHPDYPGHGLVLNKVSEYNSDYTLIGNKIRSRVLLDTPSNITSLMYWPDEIYSATIRDMWFDAGLKADHVLKADESYHPYLTIDSSDFRNGLTECVRLSTFVTSLTRVTTMRGTVGFRIVGQDGGPVTSITMNSCYALRAKECGFDFGYATYCVLNACAVDGDVESDTHTEIAYRFANAYGVTMNSCGAEKAQRFLRAVNYRGFFLSAPFMLLAGGAVSPVDYLIEFGLGTDATVAGVRVESQLPGGFLYTLAQTGSGFGSENITVLDRSVLRGSAYWVPNFRFDRPIKFLRGDSTGKSETISIGGTGAFKTAVAQSTAYSVEHDLTWQLANGVYDLVDGTSGGRFVGLSGPGTLVIQGNAGDNTLVKLQSDFENLLFRNCSLKIILRNLSIGGKVGNNGNRRLVLDNSPNIILDNVRITSDDINVGVGIYMKNASRVSLVNGSGMFGTFSTAPFVLDAASEVFIQKAPNPPTAGTWSQGNTVYNSAPVAGGSVGWVCVATGAPGTWKSFGTIAA